MDETTENFWKVWNEWNPSAPKPLYFRLYHTPNGSPVCYSREDLPGKFIDVTPVDFALADMNVRVVNGQLIRITPDMIVNKLVPSHTGTPCHRQDVAVVVHPEHDHLCWQSRPKEI